MARTDDTAPAKNDAYTGMLGISLVALIAGCIFLYLDYSRHAEKPPILQKAPAIATPSQGAEAPPSKK